MSMLLNGISPLSFGSHCFRQDRETSMLSLRKQNKIRMISASSSSSSTPYLFIGGDVSIYKEDENKVNFSLYDPGSQQKLSKYRVEILHQSLSEDLYKLETIGSSKGWVAMMADDDFTVHLTDIFTNPSSSSSKHISLPPLVNSLMEEKHTDISQVLNVSLSCPREQDGRVVVAVKFLGPYMSLCGVGDSEWTHVRTPSGFESSRVMYSERDRMFCLNVSSSCSEYSGQGLSVYDSELPPVSYLQRLPRRNLPETLSEEPGSCLKDTHLLESPSGEFFTVIRFQRCIKSGEDADYEAERFMVFRRDAEKGLEFYTEDIGDVSVFISDKGSFCVAASAYDGLVPNAVYFADDVKVGIYDLGSGTIHGLFAFYKSYPTLWLAPFEQIKF